MQRTTRMLLVAGLAACTRVPAGSPDEDAQAQPVPAAAGAPTGDGEAPLAADETAAAGDAVPDEPPAGEPASEGAECETNADCADGEQCWGPEGCDATWRCGPARMCTRDLVMYCGCDGQTFSGSGSCPQAKYSRRGSC